MSETNTLKATVSEKFDANENKPFMLYMDDDKFSTFEKPDNWDDVSEGDVVELEWFENNGGYKTIDSVTVVDSGGSGGFAKGSDVDEGGMGSKDERINRKVALKAAVEFSKGVDEDVDPATVTSVADTFAGWLNQ